jgi:hypothetical protein
MIIALLALAFAMIVGGLLSAFFGWDIVLVERGWTMVIAGSITAASGAILLGIAAAVSKLAKIETRLSQLRGGVNEDAFAEAPRSVKDLSLAALSGGLVAGTAAAQASEEDERPDETQPTLPLFEDEGKHEPVKEDVKAAEWPEAPQVPEVVMPFPPRPSVSSMPPREDDEPDMKVPDFLLAGRERDEDEEPRVIDGSDLYHRELDEREPEPRDLDDHEARPEPVVETEPESGPEPEREPVIAADSDLEAELEEDASDDLSRPAVVVGTYNSGDNKYVMFSDGSIEAQTPSGVFRFQSLDELKEFIAAGGEGNSSSSI